MVYYETGKDSLYEYIIQGKIKDNKIPEEEAVDGLYFKKKYQQEPIDISEEITSQDLEDDTDSISVSLDHCGDLVVGRKVNYINKQE